MLKLHGFTVSNYFNMVKMALIEKGIEFEFVESMPSQDHADNFGSDIDTTTKDGLRQCQ